MLLIIIITALADGISTLWCKLANIRKVVLVSHYDIVNLVPGHWCSASAQWAKYCRKKVFAEPGDRTKDYLIYAQMLYQRATSMAQIYKEQPSNNHCFCVNFHPAVKTVEDF